MVSCSLCGPPGVHLAVPGESAHHVVFPHPPRFPRRAFLPPFSTTHFRRFVHPGELLLFIPPFAHLLPFHSLAHAPRWFGDPGDSRRAHGLPGHRRRPCGRRFASGREVRPHRRLQVPRQRLSQRTNGVAVARLARRVVFSNRVQRVRVDEGTLRYRGSGIFEILIYDLGDGIEERWLPQHAQGG